MRKAPLFLLVGVFLAGCQQSSGVRDAQSGGYLPLQNATLVLHQSVEVAAGRARVFFQDGGLAGPGGLGRGTYNSYRPHCALEIDSVKHSGFVINPGTFGISLVQRSIESVVSADEIRVAAWPALAGRYGRNSDRFHDGYHFWLVSSDQPMVRRLTCYGVFARPSDLFPPTLDEINAALGDVATVGGPVPGEW